jgi:hypothetical protein
MTDEIKVCEHKFIHLETKKQKADDNLRHYRDWQRIDIFVCEKCLERKAIKQEAKIYDYGIDDPPEWW